VRVALRFAYDGAAFVNGYARQPEGATVEDALITALRTQGYVDGSWTPGSRTDKGVSAAENVAACKVDRPSITGLVPGLQKALPPGLWVTGAANVNAEWAPRYHANRTYQYLASYSGENLPLMKSGCEVFVGENDMSAFARVEPHRNPLRNVTGCSVALEQNHFCFTISSPGFLWNQVRRMVDALLVIGRGAATTDDIVASLKSGTPHSKFGLANPDGLLLKSVDYDPPIQWDADAGKLDFRRLEQPVQRLQVTNELLRSLTESS
jgi:tRNA pseudouridine38-40 synthase